MVLPVRAVVHLVFDVCCGHFVFAAAEPFDGLVHTLLPSAGPLRSASLIPLITAVAALAPSTSPLAMVREDSKRAGAALTSGTMSSCTVFWNVRNAFFSLSAHRPKLLNPTIKAARAILEFVSDWPAASDPTSFTSANTALTSAKTSRAFAFPASSLALKSSLSSVAIASKLGESFPSSAWTLAGSATRAARIFESSAIPSLTFTVTASNAPKIDFILAATSLPDRAALPAPAP